MGKTAWNDAEDAALDYLPHVDVVLYLRGIRRRMDYRTGIAGQSEPISYEWLSQIAEVRSERGSTTKVPPRMNKEALRASFARQERAGLIERISESHGRGLVFRCLLADRDQSVSGRSNPRTTPEQPQQNNPGLVNSNNWLSEQSNPRATPCCSAANNPIPESGIREEEDNPPSPPSRPVGGQPSAPGFVLPSSISPEIWEEFEQHRKAIRKPLNAQSRAKNAAVLAPLTHEQQQAAVNVTIANRWVGLFPPKVNGHATDRSTSGARFRAAAEASLAEHWDDPDPPGFSRA